MASLIGILIVLAMAVVGFAANFYLFSQWLIHPRRRRRMRACQPFLGVGWGLYLLGGSVLRPLGRDDGSADLAGLGTLLGAVGVGLTVYAAARLLRANAAERRAARAAQPAPQEGVWPPPPSRTTAHHETPG